MFSTKYNSKKTVIAGITFHSQKESVRYCELKLLERAGNIRSLELQPKMELVKPFEYNGKKERGINYVADFKYVDIKSGKTIIEDVKGFKTKEYIIKRKMLLSIIKDDNSLEFRES